AYTLAIAILISAVNALTLSPALCAILLSKQKIKEEKELEAKTLAEGETQPKRKKIKSFLGYFFTGFNTAFDKMTRRYMQSVVVLIKRRRLAFIGLVIVTIIGFMAMKFTPTSFIPDEDNGFIIFSLKLPPGSS